MNKNLTDLIEPLRQAIIRRRAVKIFSLGITKSERQTSMRKRNWFKSITLAIGCATIMLLSGLSQARSPVPFKATFHGFAEPAIPTADPDVVEIVVPLHGTGTHIGDFNERLVHLLNFVTGAFTGHADWTAANGDSFTTVFQGQLNPTDDPAVVSFEVTHAVVAGTGRFKGMTGTFKGVNGLFNLVTGEDQGGYLGTISY